MCFRFLSVVLIASLLFGCNPTNKEKISFYYWKSSFILNNEELTCLNENHCEKLYVKYFDVVKEENSIKPIATINFKSQLPAQKIVPVVFIKNEVFKDADLTTTEKLAKNILSLIDQVNFANSVSVHELQMDCDWTEKTKDSYFSFLKTLKKLFRDTISATIRLHQIKYKDVTGIPPVDKGVLMYYNMNDVTGGIRNSIYDKSTADKYLIALKEYPFPLNIALPIFAWGIQSRNGKVIALLNKMNESDFLNDACFNIMPGKNFETKNACFKSGYYFQKGDHIKIECVGQEELLQMAEDISPNLSKQSEEIIFYDLDSLNLNRYDKAVFKKVLDRFK